MRVISEDFLKSILADSNQEYKMSAPYINAQRKVLQALINQCKEINPWLPIDENTPKDRRLNLHWPGTGWVTGSWVQLNNTVGYFTHDLSRYDPPSVKPTHYQELPDDPEQGDANARNT